MGSTSPNFTYFMPNDIQWEVQTPHSRRKIIRLEKNLYVAMVQWDAGFKLPHVDHHGGEETVYVLEGTFYDGGPPCGPGSIIRGDAGTSHQPRTDDGVTFYVVRTLVDGDFERIAPNGWERP